MLRTANDKRRWDADNWRRYRCRDEACDWRGLLPTVHRAARPHDARSILRRSGRAVVMLLVAGALTWSGMQVLRYMTGL